jgi:hypothetical protein
MMDKKLELKIYYLIAWFIPLALLMFGFYRFALKPNIWLVIVQCISSVALGWLLKQYFEV